MTSKRLFFALIGLVVLIVVVIGAGTYGINSALEVRSDSLLKLKSQQQSLSQEQTQLVQMKKDIVKYNSLYQISQLIVPQSKDQTETVRQIVSLATKNKITLASITFPSSTLGSATNPSALKTGVSGGTGTAAVTPTVTPVTNPALSQLVPVTSIPGVYDLQIEVASSTTPGYFATYKEMIGFLSGLEQNRLTAQVSSIDIEPDATDPSLLSFTLSLNIYIKPS